VMMILEQEIASDDSATAASHAHYLRCSQQK